MFKKIKNLFQKNEIIKDIDVPCHIGIIMDGNGRWAKKRAMPRLVGHREGAIRLKKVISSCEKYGVKFVTVYAFSTENWKRPKDEVDGLMKLLLEFLRNAENELGGEKVRITVIGDVEGLPQAIQDEIKRVENITSVNKNINLQIALNYGGRDEVVNGIKKITEKVLSGNLKVEEINENIISENIYTSNIPDPDLIIRTSGEVRTSNFLLWQSAYSEYYFTEVLWPDFDDEQLKLAIESYKNRKRRFGGV